MLDSIGRKNRKIPNKLCEKCGIEFRPVDSKKRTCSKACGYFIRAKPSIQLRKKEVWWTGSKGYIEGRVWVDDFTQIRIKQHRWVVENNIGRKLLPHEDVHHINGIKTDNRIENLQIISHSEHTKITNNRAYKRGYKLKISESERKRRSTQMKEMLLTLKATA